MIDAAGRLFWWNGSLYRAIKPEKSEFYRRLIEENVLQDLFGKGLIETEIAPITLDGYELVLKHRPISFASYCMEWPFAMLKDAALLMCRLSIELFERGLILKDSHPWNILFDATTPVFVDWGSIANCQEKPNWPYLEFRNRFIYPLYLMSAKHTNFLTRNWMLDVVNSPSRGDVFRLLIRRVPLLRCLDYLWRDFSLARSSIHPNRSFFISLQDAVQAIEASPQTTEWSNYEGPDDHYEFDDAGSWPSKIKNVHSLICRLKPKTVMDIGCNKGWFSQLAAREVARVIAVDVDETGITRLYQKSRSEKLLILPLVMDICSPTPPHGVCGGYPSARDRFQVDMVMALAIIHHLVFKRGLTFEAIVDQISAFTKKWLIAEFVPPEDSYVSQWMEKRFSWYHLNGFVKALESKFHRVEIFDSSPSSRVLLFCER